MVGHTLVSDTPPLTHPWGRRHIFVIVGIFYEDGCIIVESLQSAREPGKNTTVEVLGTVPIHPPRMSLIIFVEYCGHRVVGEGQDVGVAHSGVSCGDCCSGPTLAHVDCLKHPPEIRCLSVCVVTESVIVLDYDTPPRLHDCGRDAVA